MSRDEVTVLQSRAPRPSRPRRLAPGHGCACHRPPRCRPRSAAAGGARRARGRAARPAASCRTTPRAPRSPAASAGSRPAGHGAPVEQVMAVVEIEHRIAPRRRAVVPGRQIDQDLLRPLERRREQLEALQPMRRIGAGRRPPRQPYAQPRTRTPSPMTSAARRRLRSTACDPPQPPRPRQITARFAPPATRSPPPSPSH